MQFEEFIKNLGFDINPFQFSNADKEHEYISDYFIKPDYFEDIWGNPYSPVSNIVYAPRGAGKTAQRIMLEKRVEQSKDLLAIVYTNHDLSNFKSIDEVNITYHLTYLNRLLLLAFFNRILNPTFDFTFTFDLEERQFLFKLTRIYLYETPISFPSQAIDALKTPTDYAIDIWKNFKEPITNIIKQFSKKQGIEIDLSKIDIDKKLELSHRDNFLNIVSLLKKSGYKSIFFLIDKVDEQSLTGNNPQSSFTLIEDLLKDLELLETNGLSFKFFLWDKLKPFTSNLARTDRVFSYNLKWDIKQLRTMFNKRVEAYSKGRVTDFMSLFEDPKSFGRIIIFSELSPRDCVRICHRILSEQFKKNFNATKFEKSVVDTSIQLFCEEKAQELIPNSNLNYLKKFNQVSMTIEELATNKVAKDSQTIRNIISPWNNAGYMTKIGLLNRKNAKSVNEYAILDSRLAYIACPKLKLQEFIDQKVRRCEECKTIFYRDFDRKQYECPKCQTMSLSF